MNYMQHIQALEKINVKISRASKDNTTLINYDISLKSEQEITNFCEKGILSKELKEFLSCKKGNKTKSRRDLIEKGYKFMCFEKNTCVCELDPQPRFDPNLPPHKIYFRFRFLPEESIDLENNLIASTALRNLLPQKEG